jgi:hypothetical protein
MDFLLTVGFVFLFAWVARGLVGARELTWRRTLLAAFVGVVFGMAVAILLLVRDFTQEPGAVRSSPCPCRSL